MKLTRETIDNIIPIVETVLLFGTEKKPIKSYEIIEYVNRNEYVFLNEKQKLNQEKLRGCIHYLRANSIKPVISNKNGYYIAYDEQDISNMYESLLLRSQSILNAANGLRKIIIKK